MCIRDRPTSVLILGFFPIDCKTELRPELLFELQREIKNQLTFCQKNHYADCPLLPSQCLHGCGLAIKTTCHRSWAGKWYRLPLLWWLWMKKSLGFFWICCNFLLNTEGKCTSGKGSMELNTTYMALSNWDLHYFFSSKIIFLFHLNHLFRLTILTSIHLTTTLKNERERERERMKLVTKMMYPEMWWLGYQCGM